MDHSDHDDGTFIYAEIVKLSEKFPLAFYPLYQLQIQVIRNTLGEYWWESHKANVHDLIEEEKQKEMALLKKKQQDANEALAAMNEEIVKKRMGILYFLMPWARKKERLKIARIAAIEGELEEQFQQTKAQHH